MTNMQPQQTNPWGAESLINRYYAFIDSLPSAKRKTYGFGWLGIAVVLIVVASVPLPSSLRWVSSIAGSPAGVIIFLLGLGVIYGTSLKDFSPFNFRQLNPPRRRLPIAITILVLVAIILITSSSFMPVGVGGTIIIVAALSAYNIIRRTPQELQWAAQGLVDPREIDDEDEN